MGCHRNQAQLLQWILGLLALHILGVSVFCFFPSQNVEKQPYLSWHLVITRNIQMSSCLPNIYCLWSIRRLFDSTDFRKLVRKGKFRIICTYPLRKQEGAEGRDSQDQILLPKEAIKPAHSRWKDWLLTSNHRSYLYPLFNPLPVVTYFSPQLCIKVQACVCTGDLPLCLYSYLILTDGQQIGKNVRPLKIQLLLLSFLSLQQNIHSSAS